MTGSSRTPAPRTASSIRSRCRSRPPTARRIYAARYSSEGRSRSLYFSTDARALKERHPELEQLAAALRRGPCRRLGAARRPAKAPGTRCRRPRSGSCSRDRTSWARSRRAADDGAHDSSGVTQSFQRDEPGIQVTQGVLRITWIGHSTVLLELDGTRLLTDPVLRTPGSHTSGGSAGALRPGRPRARSTPCSSRTSTATHSDLPLPLSASDARRHLLVPAGAGTSAAPGPRVPERITELDVGRRGSSRARSPPRPRSRARRPSTPRSAPSIPALGLPRHGLRAGLLRRRHRSLRRHERACAPASTSRCCPSRGGA